MNRLGFVQADPIRAPSRAQDLILRHRVRGYRAGDLDRSFARLGLEEDFLYAYGFMPPNTARLLHPRPDPDCEAGVHAPAGLAAEVLAFVRSHGPTHPRDLEQRFGRERAVNGWGGFSKATTRALEELHHYGLLRVAQRRDGIRVYTAVPPSPARMELEPSERARQLVMLVARLLAPVSAVSLRGALALMARRNPGLGPLGPVVAAALRRGELEQEAVEGETYLRPAAGSGWQHDPAPSGVRLLAPFDPVVWDRRRFEHLWGWAYRFEAYTPPPQRQFGYYALPLLWRGAVIGWANLTLPGGKLDAAIGYAHRAPMSMEFRRALDAELARVERFLTPTDAVHRRPGRVGVGNSAT
ncbi:DNA glycosylase AlkZ-like family protein [Roseomonas sp. BN140053]|uniref:DNA glycosylase AlkZ-like family protein n=1 Tax=Roseomonas sp. BN140053 TaxID=3391898 RepID=UPI0039EBF51B